MSSTYRRIIQEHAILNKDIEHHKNNNYHDFLYKIITIDNGLVLFKSEIQINYKNKNHYIDVFYKKNYPFSSPLKLLLNGTNIFKIYKKIMNDNKDIITDCICCKSLLCSNIWVVMNTIKNIIEEILKIIDYKNLYIERRLLNKITEKYTNQHLDYLHYYLL